VDVDREVRESGLTLSHGVSAGIIDADGGTELDRVRLVGTASAIPVPDSAGRRLRDSRGDTCCRAIRNRSRYCSSLKAEFESVAGRCLCDPGMVSG
jgi:hypothetical protein